MEMEKLLIMFLKKLSAVNESESFCMLEMVRFDEDFFLILQQKQIPLSRKGHI